jgi:hypothetical protein
VQFVPEKFTLPQGWGGDIIDDKNTTHNKTEKHPLLNPPKNRKNLNQPNNKPPPKKEQHPQHKQKTLS